MKLYFASSNPNKIKEINSIIPGNFEIRGLPDLNFHDDIPETSPTIFENAVQKAKFIYDRFHVNCFADDSGLEVPELNNEPGVFSARYAGPDKNDENNILKLLNNLAGSKNRKARFITVIALIINGKLHTFTGTINGTITTEKRGVMGFGYDPVFLPDGFSKTFAEMSPGEKNAISHRAIAVNKLVDFLKNSGL